MLIVDDEQGLLELFAAMVRPLGCRVELAQGGQQAITMLDEQTPDLLILDVMMPHIDGLEVTRRIRQRLDIPIIMLSAKGETSDKVLGLEMGADDYLAKPFELSLIHI